MFFVPFSMSKFYESEINGLLVLYNQEVTATLDDQEIQAANDNMKNPSVFLRYGGITNMLFYINKPKFSNYLQFYPGTKPPFSTCVISLRLNDGDTIQSLGEGKIDF